ncbi:ABC transporter ATP-binding protein [Rhodohalobacter sp.]|uniref:ABC transporter ATP-binding protein n=1 Tax=Rhodohalobacter sp. TaxID=1974210 RepID=UPI002ACDFBAE|nr:ABC transporter ATP-binding protein [Rhodohalobacter sp.]MDZ7758581.1 ABC transporter ATP-binding protein [Rhodohalobacter sp.]
MNILTAEKVVKAYSKNRKSRPFRLEIEQFNLEQGNFSAILGPNGSGKTTFLKAILDLRFLSEGYIQINGIDHRDKSARKAVSYLPEVFSFPDDVSVKTMLLDFGSIEITDREYLEDRITSLAQKLKADFLDKKIKELSKGMRQTTALLHTFLTERRLYILDEPFNGLDAVQKKVVMDFLLGLKEKEKISVLITTHILPDIDKICDTIHLIRDGNIFKSASNNHIAEKFGSVEQFYLEQFGEGAVL